jgi:hypothetical protein
LTGHTTARLARKRGKELADDHARGAASLKPVTRLPALAT